MIEFQTQLNVVNMIIDHVKVPVTVDIESGYGEDDQSIVENVLRLACLGVSGINIEDSHKKIVGLKPLSQQCKSKIRTKLEENG